MSTIRKQLSCQATASAADGAVACVCTTTVTLEVAATATSMRAKEFARIQVAPSSEIDCCGTPGYYSYQPGGGGKPVCSICPLGSPCASVVATVCPPRQYTPNAGATVRFGCPVGHACVNGIAHSMPAGSVSASGESVSLPRLPAQLLVLHRRCIDSESDLPDRVTWSDDESRLGIAVHAGLYLAAA